MTDRRCKGTTKAGNPCQAPFVDPAVGYCVAHRPGGTGEMRERGKRGAEATRRLFKGRGTVKSSKAPAPPETMEDAKNLSSWATHAVLTGEIDPKVGQVVTGLLREFRGATKEAEMAKEIERLRSTVAELKKGGSK